jgi:RNA polymerase sigma-70 factor (ECF subfamily)
VLRSEATDPLWAIPWAAELDSVGCCVPEDHLAPPRESESVLIERLLAGDEEAFTTLVTRHQRAMRAVARLYTPDPSVAEEVVQETWVAILSGLRSFERRSSLRTWMFRILANRARSRGEREAKIVPLSSLAEAEPEAIVDAARFDGRGMWAIPPRRWEADTPEAIALRAELLAAVEAATEALPPRQRAAILLRDVEEVEPAEICEILGITDGALRILLHRARGAIRTAIDRRLGGPG